MEIAKSIDVNELSISFDFLTIESFIPGRPRVSLYLKSELITTFLLRNRKIKFDYSNISEATGIKYVHFDLKEV